MEKTGAEGGRQNQAGIAASGNVDDDADRQRQRDRFQPARGIFFFVRKDDDHRPGRQNGASRQHRHR